MNMMVKTVRLMTNIQSQVVEVRLVLVVLTPKQFGILKITSKPDGKNISETWNGPNDGVHPGIDGHSNHHDFGNLEFEGKNQKC